MGEHLRAGNNTGLEALLHSGFGRTPRGQIACDHYLPANRFEWWDLDEGGKVPPTGPIGADPSEVYRIFYSEFCSPLSTVVGADLQAVGSVGAMTWDSVADGSSPNSVPLIEFSVRTLRPGSVPVVREVEVILGPARVTPGVLYQIQERDAMVVEVRFVPVGVGPVETKLVALTNAGRLEVRLLGDGIS